MCVWLLCSRDNSGVSLLQEEAVALEEYLAKRQKLGKNTDDKVMEEKTVLHSKNFFFGMK